MNRYWSPGILEAFLASLYLGLIKKLNDVNKIRVYGEKRRNLKLKVVGDDCELFHNIHVSRYSGVLRGIKIDHPRQLFIDYRSY